MRENQSHMSLTRGINITVNRGKNYPMSLSRKIISELPLFGRSLMDLINKTNISADYSIKFKSTMNNYNKKISRIKYPKSFRSCSSRITGFSWPPLPTNRAFLSYWSVVSWRPLKAWQTYFTLKKNIHSTVHLHKT